MPFIKNIWYVAAWSSELEVDKPMGRVVIGEPVVFWRDRDGALIAMEDRCPHRHAPLSKGRIEGDEIRCMYHGLKFSKKGQCTHVPGSEKIPPNSDVKRYPTVEKYDWVWVWLGDPVLADEAKIPRAFGLDNEIFIGLPGNHLDYNAHYELINDNLLDLSHLDFVHETSLGPLTGKKWSQEAPDVTVIDDGLLIERWNTIPIGPDSPSGDSWNVTRYIMPGFFLQETLIFPAGTAQECDFKRPPDDLEPISAAMDQQAVTPISETVTRYLYTAGYQKKYLHNATPADRISETVAKAFAEDHAMIEAQQRIWNLTDSGQRKAFIPYDKAPSIFRKMIARRLREEVDAS